ncbi:O-antigen ligase [Methylotenera sp.]|uniref:O-antigen ligase family protein n=1 Tax=Methylotenera sp. TaxID=2051956 RepID=UPI002731245F|nr:O-antigen ligase family protein [Methylotenera sp.]MDP1523622.1 O-antigen ligase family protein [Methylotenera sp.]MDP2071647.1 O-antigen ligase family protein [Methylotenera sp.]MDP3006737.1 O-antigen ligase family protein [Methylotenera sp.]MDP3308413.1 O-antigen ligase family protein [Methylotenera sp.]
MDSQPIKKYELKLMMTDYFFLFGIWLAIYWAIDPFDWRLDYRGAGIKHFPIIAITPAFILAFVGGVLFKNKPYINMVKESSGNKKLSFIIWVFAIFVTIGSLYARFASGIENSFLALGLYAMTAPLMAWFVRGSANPVKLIKGIIFIYLFWALISISMQFVKYGSMAVFHSREHLALAGVAILYFLAKSKLAKLAVVFFIAIAAFAGHKNTAYMIALLLFLFFFIVGGIGYAKTIKDGFVRWMFWIRVALVSTISSTVIGLVYLYVKSTLPTGNPEYRLHTYEIAWNKFLSSPIWGNGYTRAATEKFELFTVATSTQVLPTHSDPLDILANGGLIGFLLWASVFALLIRRWYLLSLNPEKQLDASLVPYLHALFCLTFSGVVVCAFNPILNSPNNAWAFWAPVGVLIAALRVSGNADSNIQKVNL